MPSKCSSHARWYERPRRTVSVAPVGRPCRSSTARTRPARNTASGSSVRGRTSTSPFTPCGFFSRPTARWVGPVTSADRRLGEVHREASRLLEDARDGFRGRGALLEPRSRLLHVHSDLLVLRAREVVPDQLDEPSVARGLRVRHDDPIAGLALASRLLDRKSTRLNSSHRYIS